MSDQNSPQPSDEELERRRFQEMDNVDIVTHMMEFSPTGVLTQLFVMVAIESYAKGVLNGSLGVPANGLISPDAWRRSAEYILETLNKRFEKEEPKDDET
jgi:hypothetical protein